MGLNELMLNAIEHGNLGIGYRKKERLLREGRWREEVERRLGLPENGNKFASLIFEATEEAIVVRIEDQGDGFDWRSYLDFSLDRADDPNGRGIAAARELAFPNLSYQGSGNVARCAAPLPRKAGG